MTDYSEMFEHYFAKKKNESPMPKSIFVVFFRNKDLGLGGTTVHLNSKQDRDAFLDSAFMEGATDVTLGIYDLVSEVKHSAGDCEEANIFDRLAAGETMEQIKGTHGRESR